MPLRLEIVTGERLVFSDEVDMVIAPGVEGQLGILPKHAPLLTALSIGELRVKKGQEELSFAIGGGFMEVYKDKVIVLADTAERAEEIDIARAEEARRRALESLKERGRLSREEFAQAEARLRKAVTRIKVAQRYRRLQLPKFEEEEENV
jgi:F-type H+-transporting ATPase subunit epsilon